MSDKKIKIMIAGDFEDVEKFKEFQKEYKKKGYAVNVLFKDMVNAYVKVNKEF